MILVTGGCGFIGARFVLHWLAGEPVPLYGDGFAVRDCLHVDDHVAALVAVLEHAAPGQSYHVAGHQTMTNLASIERPVEAFRVETRDRPGHDRRQAMDDSKVRSRTGAPRASLRVLLLGGHGRLGSAIAARFGPQSRALADGRIELLAPARRELALDPKSPAEAATRWYARWRPDVVVNCIALSDVDRCAREPVSAAQLNAALPAALARAAARSGARLIHFSTDYVFDGTLRRPYREDDAPGPLSVYGATKLDGERAIADAGCRHWIFRISWLYGAAQSNLSAMLLEPASAGRTIRLANDRLGVPNPVQLLAQEVTDCVARDVLPGAAPPLAPSGLYHLSCHGATSWYDFGVALVREAIRTGRLAAARAPKLEGFAEATLARPAQRPAYSALDPSRYESSFGRVMPHWEAAIAAALGRQ